MSKVSETFRKLQEEKRKALITYITAGDPNLEITKKLIFALEKAKVDIIELGVPFSDPLADGPVIQASHQRALKASLSDVFDLVGTVKLVNGAQVPIVLMLSYNLIVKYGVEEFYDDAEENGVDGVIIPDLPPEEFMPANNNVDTIFLIAPTSTEERIKMIAEKSAGFIYLVSVTGVTGKRKMMLLEVLEYIDKVKGVLRNNNIEKPIAIGFGVASPAMAQQYCEYADGVIVGSAIVEIMVKNKKNPIPSVIRFVSSLRRAIDQC